MSSSRPGEKWTPPPWHAPTPGPDDPPTAPSKPLPALRPPRGAPSSRPSDDVRPVVLGFAFAPGITGFGAIAFALANPLSGSRGLPFALVLLCIVQIVGYAVTKGGGADALSRTWIIALVTTAGALPLLAIQSNLLQQEYVALSRHSATSAIGATLVILMLLVVAALWCVGALWSIGEIASIAFAPLALLIPGMLGIHSTISQRMALEALGASSLLAAGIAVIAWSVPRPMRPYLPFIALCGDFAALWIAGRGPKFPSSSGAIVLFLYLLTMFAALALTIAIPIVARWLGNAMQALENEERPRQ